MVSFHIYRRSIWT